MSLLFVVIVVVVVVVVVVNVVVVVVVVAAVVVEKQVFHSFCSRGVEQQSTNARCCRPGVVANDQ